MKRFKQISALFLAMMLFATACGKTASSSETGTGTESGTESQAKASESESATTPAETESESESPLISPLEIEVTVSGSKYVYDKENVSLNDLTKIFDGLKGKEGAHVTLINDTATWSTYEKVTKALRERKVPFEDSIAYAIPTKMGIPYSGEKGTVETITYQAKDYIGDGAGCEKKAHVYLPAGYDENKKYNVIYLMHGIGGSEDEWGLQQSSSKIRYILDNLIGKGIIEPIIVVTPNGKALACPYTDATNAFYQFGYELRNDLIPYIESHYATYGEYKEGGYDLTAARDHRAMAGLSMGGMQTINIGICECLDIISWFGAFSAAPTSYQASKVASTIDASEYKVNYFYNICGTEDNIAYSSSSTAAKSLDKLSTKMVSGENYMWQERSGAHDFAIWNLGFYNFAQIAFQENK